MVRQYRKFDEDFKSAAARLLFETGKPIWQVARGLGSTRAPSATGLRWHAINVTAGTGHSARTSGPSWRGCPEEDAELRMQRDVLIGHVEARVRACRGGRLAMS